MGESLKFLDREITKNYIIFDDWGNVLVEIVEIDTLSGFYIWTAKELLLEITFELLLLGLMVLFNIEGVSLTVYLLRWKIILATSLYSRLSILLFCA